MAQILESFLVNENKKKGFTSEAREVAKAIPLSGVEKFREKFTKT